MTDTPYDSTVLGVGTIDYATNAPKPKLAPHAYLVTLLNQGRVRDAYRLDSFSVSGEPVTVYHHRKSGNLSCGTHGTANTCAHCAALREYLDDTTQETVYAA